MTQSDLETYKKWETRVNRLQMDKVVNKRNKLRIQHGETHGDQTEVEWSSSHLAPLDARKKSKRTGYNHILVTQRFSRFLEEPMALQARRVRLPFPGSQVDAVYIALYVQYSVKS